MPPSATRKRRSPEKSSALEPPPKRVARGSRRAKTESVFEASDASKPGVHAEEQRKFLETLEDSETDGSPPRNASNVAHNGLTPASPVRYTGRGHTAPKSVQTKVLDDANDASSDEEEGEEQEEHDEWGSFLAEHDESQGPRPLGHAEVNDSMEITLDKVKEVRRSDLTAHDQKKGPSKVERQIRIATHQLHVSALMYHDYVRNHWLNDQRLQKALMDQLSRGCEEEIQRWRKACGDKSASQGNFEMGKPTAANMKQRTTAKKTRKSTATENARDWGPAAMADEIGDSHPSHSDPTLRLLKILSAFWRKRFRRTSPGLRKHGYKDLERIQHEMRAYRESDGNGDEFGERVESLERLVKMAEKAEGSRDLGAQLFTSMLRGVGLEARMVASLQPAGHSWAKGEEADPLQKQPGHRINGTSFQESPVPISSPSPGRKKQQTSKSERQVSKPTHSEQSRSTIKGQKGEPINLVDDDDSPLSDPPDSDLEESLIEFTSSKPINQSQKRYDGDLHYPHYWTEVLSPVTGSYIPVDSMCLSTVASSLDSHSLFEPRGGGAERSRQVMAYVVGFNPEGSAKDVTTRYLKRHMWPGKTKGLRYPVEKVPVYNKKGKIIRHEQYDWFKDVMSLYQPSEGLHSAADDLEDSRELQPVHANRKAIDKAPVESLQFYKTSADYVLERHLRREEAFLPHAQPLKHFKVGKGDKATNEAVYRRSEVVACKSSESWHKEGRQVKVGEQPLKRVPMRAVTAIRKAEAEQIERETGVKAQQALFSQDQTEWIIPPPIENGEIPKNAFGNIDVYVPTMVPQGAAHVPLRGTAKICKKLGIEFAEACTGFEFGNRIAIPVLTGVVVAVENRKMLADAWREEEKIRKEKEGKKREKVALSTWRKFLAGLRVVERVRAEYGIVDEKKLHKEMEQEIRSKRGAAGHKHTKGPTHANALALPDDVPKQPQPSQAGLPEATGDTGGGFLPEGFHAEIIDRQSPTQHVHGARADDGGFIIETDEGAITPTTDSILPGAKSAVSLREQAAQADSGLGSAQGPLQQHALETCENGIEWRVGQEGVMEARPSAVPQNQAVAHINGYTHKDSANTSTAPRKRGRPRKISPSTTLTEGKDFTAEENSGRASDSDGDKDSDVYDEPPAKKSRSKANRGVPRRKSGRLR